jgi:hypothetical protein
MCANCKADNRCPCTGGAVLAMCSCVRGYHCPVCGHAADATMAVEPELLIEIISPDSLGESRAS